MNTTKFPLIVISIFAITPLLTAMDASQRNYALGDRTLQMPARAEALGRNYLVGNSPVLALWDPAGLAQLKKYPIALDKTIGAGWSYEKINHSDSRFDENSRTLLDLAPSLAAAAGGRNWKIAAGLVKVSDYNYSYREESYAQGRRVALEKIEDHGQESAIFLAGAFWHKFISVGGGIARHSSEPRWYQENSKFHPISGTLLENAVTRSESTFRGDQIYASVAIQNSDSWRAALAINFPYWMSETRTDFTTELEQKTQRSWRMPLAIQLGGHYGWPKLATAPTLYLSFGRSFWDSNPVDISLDPGVENFVESTQWHFGLEHFLTAQIPFRYGFAFEDFYGRDDSALYNFSLGSGWHSSAPKWAWGIDCSYSYRFRSVAQLKRLTHQEESSSFINLDSMDSAQNLLLFTIFLHF